MEVMAEGNSLYRKGSVFAWTGAALLPLSLLALIPVANDGAFGITAADPGIGGFIGLAGLGLIHIGIPIMGLGADRLEAGAQVSKSGFQFQSRKSAVWSLYRQSWILMGLGAASLALAMPFTLVATLDWTNERTSADYAARTLVITGIALGGAGLLQQEYCWYGFSQTRRNADAALRAAASLSLQPVLSLGRLGRPGSESAGLKLVARF